MDSPVPVFENIFFGPTVMRIESSAIEMQSSHQRSQRLEVSERLEFWRGERPGRTEARPEPPHPRVSISAAARHAQAADEVAAEQETKADPKLAMLIRLVEMLTGKPVRLFDARDLHHDAAPTPDGPHAETPSANRPPEQRAGFGLAYDVSREYSERETTRFSASGTVRTADGAQIDFSLELEMSRSYSESSSFSLRAGDARMKDPLMLDFAGPAAALSDQRFSFDLDADGTLESLPIPGGSGLLAFDRNGNGQVDDGRELFGAMSGDGFAELAALDEDANGWIDESDGAWSSLRVWRPDAEGNGQLLSLGDAQVGALYLGRVDTPFRVTDAANDTLGQVRSTGLYLREDGSVGSVSQVDLAI
jgi:hypothetical protein